MYKHFPDVESILRAHHQRHVAAYLAQLAELRERVSDPADRLRAVLEAYALICHYRQGHGSDELSALVHRGEGIARAQEGLLRLFEDVLVDVDAAGSLRRDTSPEELARFCLHALNAAGALPSEAAVRRLAAVTLTGLSPTSTPSQS